MESQRSRDTLGSITSSKSFFTRSLTRRESTKPDAENEPSRGPLGLTTVYSPESEVAADLIFVHGLNGDSRNTWSRNGDAALFWPKEWLPKDSAFQDVRIHTFGYSSSVLRESAVLNVPDFARSLLGAIQDAPTIPQESSSPLVFVGHSMGGLVIKKAFILGHQIAEFNHLVERTRAIFFLATPHQGADIAVVLNRILAIMPGAKTTPFVNDLFPSSPVLQSINDEFPRLCDQSSSLQVFSFFETRAMNYGVGRGLIVEKHCAVMNYPRERRMHLDANHRDVARFTSQEDPSFITVRNALAAFMDAVRRTHTRESPDIPSDQLEDVYKFLGAPDTSDDDILMQDSRRLQGSGDWFFHKSNFEQWRNACSSKLLWLRGRPGAGKSFLAGNAVKHLRQQNVDCCCFFFESGDSRKSTVNAFLRSMAFQMAAFHPEIQDIIKELSGKKDATVDLADHNAVWRHLYLAGGILKVKLSRQQYWVIDAMDECKTSSDLLNFLARAQELWTLCILVTSRYRFEPSMTHRSEVLTDTVDDEDIAKDISLFLKTNIDFLPAASAQDRSDMAKRILESSRGCFLWANLIMNELRQVHTLHETNMVLDSTPSDMNELYQKILDDMVRARFGKDLAKAILTWVTCSFRPLSVEELHAAIELDIADAVDDMEKSVISYCGNLVYVDSRKRFQLIHSTVREFLLSNELQSEFAIEKTTGHTRLVETCIRCLIEHGRKDKRPGSQSNFKSQRCSQMVDYASQYLFQHLIHTDSTNDKVVSLLARFFGSTSILNWLEYIAARSDLRKVYQAGKTVLNLLSRRAHHTLDIGTYIQHDLTKLNAWGQDLIHLVTKFSHRLRQSPGSIHQLIPPLCPPDSIIRRQACIPNRGLSIHGLSGSGWDTCLTTIRYEKQRKPFSFAAGMGYFALGMSTGNIILYDDTIFQESRVLTHQEPVWLLKFGETGRYMASSSAKSIKIWDTESWDELYKIPLKSLPIAMSFLDGDTTLLYATKKNELVEWDLLSGSIRKEPIDWTRDFAETEEGPDLHLRQPTLAAYSPHQNLLAVIYRGEDILLWDVEQERIHDMYEKDTGSRNNGSLKLADGTTTVFALAFSAASDTYLLATSYADGDLILYDTYSGDVKKVVRSANTLALASSPDGRTLVGADTRGDIVLFDFEDLKYLYRISIANQTIRPKFVNFTAGGEQVIDIRATQCRVWQPTILFRQDLDDEKSDTVSISTGLHEVDYQILDRVAITAIHCVKPARQANSLVFCGREDGSVYIYDVTGEPSGKQLFLQNPGCAITEIHFDDNSGLLTCSDRSSKVTARKLSRLNRAYWNVADPELSVGLDLSIFQLLGSGQNRAVLVSSINDASLWSTEPETKKLATIDTTGKGARRWLPHPKRHDYLIQLQAASVEIRSWSNLGLLGSIALSGNESPLEAIALNCIPVNNPRYFVTTASACLMNDPTHSRIDFWDFNEFQDDGPEVASFAPLCTLWPASTNYEAAVGIYGDRFVYIDTSYWVCSIEICQHPEAPVRHFFIPNDWLSLVNQLVFEIGKVGEIIFVKESDLVVIKRGLEVTESGAPFYPRRRSSAAVVPLMRPGISALSGRSIRTT
ncbi:GPI inositol-deacylase [Apiospora saccharicola]